MATDPLDPQFDRWLRSIEPRSELVMRYAMRIRWPEVRANRKFSARIDELQAQLPTDEDYLALIQKDARTAAEKMEELIEGKPKR